LLANYVTAILRNKDRHSVHCFCDILTEAGDDEDATWKHKNISENVVIPWVQEACRQDMERIQEADTIVLILPAGASSHMEAGYAKGLGKKLYVLVDETISAAIPKAEVMYCMADRIVPFSLNGSSEFRDFVNKLLA